MVQIVSVTVRSSQMSTATLIQATKKERPGILQDILLLELTGEEKTMTCHQVKLH
jgi:hypothetical protein